MNQSKIEKKVRKVLLQVLKRVDPNLSAKDITRETPLFGKGIGIDSIGIHQLVVGLEEEFDIIIEDDEVGTELFASLGALADYVSAKVA